MKHKTFFLLLFLVVFSSCKEIAAPHSPTVESTTKPWTRWWWLGNAVEESSIDETLEAFAKAGLGGVEIATIYGAKGAEDKFIDHLSPAWIAKVNHTLQTAKRLGLGVDLTLGTGWPFGGPQVEPEYAATKMRVEIVEVDKGKPLNHKVELIHEKINVPLKRVAAVAFDSTGKAVDLTDTIANDTLIRMAQDQAYKLYLVYADKTAQKVKRASPGGAGWTLDHFSTAALKDYLEPYNTSFTSLDKTLRSVFNDSYEVYGTDFSPNFFDHFKQKRGYDLKPHIEKLLNETSDAIGNRIKADYRQTLSDMLLEDFNVPWNEWAHSKGLKTRLQAHGSPGNLIDLYASADIPECETFGSMPYSIEGFRRLDENIRKGDADPAMLRFSSSAAHISGKPLVSAESFTWLREHFKTALSQCKPEVEDLFLNGVNHVFLHGSTYSPSEAAWPGWKFYASVNFHPSNPIWEDVAALFNYITTVQSYLQAGTPDNDVLIYWPFHDITNSFLEGKKMQQLAIHDLDTWLKPTGFYKDIQWLIQEGYGFDYLSDQFLEKITVEKGVLKLPGGSYKALLIPKTKHLPMASLEKLIALKKAGAHILFEDLPQTVPGFKNYQEETTKMKVLLDANKLTTTPIKAWDSILIQSGAKPEKWVNTGLKYIRRKWNNETLYYIVNHTSSTIKEWLPLGVPSENVTIFDLLSAKEGRAQTKKIDGIQHTRVEIKSGNSLVLRTDSKASSPMWNYYEPFGTSISLEGKWELQFVKGGPQLPPALQLDSLVSWTELGSEYENFSGTGVYEHRFTVKENAADAWLLQLIDLRESAKIWLDGTLVGTLWANPYEIQLPKIKPGAHTLKIQVSNLGANRIRAKERRGEEWKNFYEINMVNKDYQAFDATQWELTPSGIINTPKMIPLKLSK